MADRYEKQVILNNEAYNLGRNNQASPILLYTYVCDGFTCAALGHLSAQNQDSKELFIECVEHVTSCKETLVYANHNLENGRNDKILKSGCKVVILKSG